MKVKYYSHATFQLHGDRGGRLLTDPWLYNPIYGHMIWQFPECPVPRAEYVDQDVLYISHDHPDHFCNRTLELFSREIPVLIRQYDKSIRMREHLKRLGFVDVIEISHRETVALPCGLTVTLIADPDSSDSLLIVTDGVHTVLDQNDCIPTMDDQVWIGENFEVDLGLLFYSGGSQYPACFDMPMETKRRATEERISSQMQGAIEAAGRMGIRTAIPAANDMCSYRQPEFDLYASALPVEFRDYAVRHGANLEVLLVSPGEIYSFCETADAFNKYFSDRAAWTTAANALRQRADVMSIADRLQKIEQAELFDHRQFQRLMRQYFANTEQIAKEASRTGDDIAVEFTVEDRATDRTYFIHRRSGRWNLDCKEDLQKETCVDLHMSIRVSSQVVAMAMVGKLTWEDLLNGQYRISRPNNSFDKNEYEFWELLSGFTAFLEDADEQPELAERGRIRVVRPDFFEEFVR